LILIDWGMDGNFGWHFSLADSIIFHRFFFFFYTPTFGHTATTPLGGWVAGQILFVTRLLST